MNDYIVNKISVEEIVPIAKAMREKGAMLTMIHGHVDKEGAFVVAYDYQKNKHIESYQITTTEKSIPSISEIYDSAAAWPEREINELMGLEFEGLDTSLRLFLPEDQLDERGHIIVTPLSELVANRDKNLQ